MAATALASPLPNHHKVVLPSIVHPQSRVNSKNLQVRGESRGSDVHASGSGSVIRRITPTDGRTSRLSAHRRSRSASAMPGSIREEPLKAHSRMEGVTIKTSEEIEQILREKLSQSSNVVTLKNLFKVNDPLGVGNISRDAFQRVLIGLLGYITKEQVAEILKRYDLDGNSTLNFDLIESNILHKKSTTDEWMNPVQQCTIQSPTDRSTHSVPVGGGSHDGIKRQGLVTAAFCYSLIKERTKRGEFNIREHFPPSCFAPGGVVLEPQLCEFVAAIGYELTEEQRVKLWQRYDPKAIGATKTVEFLAHLGLDSSGKPKKLPKLLSPTVSNKPETPRTSASLPKSPEPQAESPAKKATPRIRFNKPAVMPRMRNVIDCLHYKFEVNYNALIEGMKCFDFLGDGMISVQDLKKVLKEFGFEIGAIDLDGFLNRCGMRPIQGQIQYADLLLKFWNRSERSLVHRVITNDFHCFGKHKWSSSDAGLAGLSAEQMEAKLIDFIHGDFLRLLANLQKCDKHRLAVVTQYEFRDLVDHALGYKMDAEQFQTLKENIVLDPDGLVPYVKFMEMFNIKPGAWNERAETATGIILTKVDRSATPAEVERLRQKAKPLAWAPDTGVQQQPPAATGIDDTTADTIPVTSRETSQPPKAVTIQTYRGRSLQELRNSLYEFFQVYFHSFDKVFKNLDRRMTGRFHKQQFKEMLKECDYNITLEELNLLWPALPTSEDNMISFISLIRYFAKPNYGPPEIQGKLPIEDSIELIEKARQVRRQREQEERASREKLGMTDQLDAQQNKKQRRVTDEERNAILDSIRRQVVTKWSEIKEEIRKSDHAGFENVTFVEMQRVFFTLGIKLSTEELESLLHCYDFYNNGRFHYMEFLKYYTNKAQAVKIPTEQHPDVQQETQRDLSRLRGPWVDQLTEKYKSLKRAFRKYDSDKTGVLDVKVFKAALKSCHVSVSDDDLFHILSAYDPKLQGKISYEDFLNDMTNF